MIKPPNSKYTYGSVPYWQQQIESARQWRRQRSKLEHWPKYVDIYEQNIRAPSEPYFNLIYSLASIFIPSTVFHTPHIMNSARRPEYSVWAQLFDTIDNAILQESRLQILLKRAVVEIFLKNLVGLELNWDFPEMFELSEREAELEFPKTPNVLDHTRRINYPWFDLISAERLLLSVGTRDKYSMRWWGKEITKPVRVLKELPGINKKAVQANKLHSDVSKQPGQNLSDIDKEEQGFMSYVEIHSIEKGTWGWLDPTSDQWLLTPREDRLQVDGPSLEILTLNLGISSIWGTPTACYIHSQNEEINECKLDARIHRKQSLLRLIVDAAIWTEKNCVDFLQSAPVGFIRLDMNQGGPEKRIEDTYAELQPHVPREFYEYIDKIRDEAQFLASVGNNQAGILAPGRRTKAEIQLVEAVSRQKNAMTRQDIANMVGSHGNRINTLVTQNWKFPQIRQIVGVDGALYWVQANPVDFRHVSQQLVTRVNADSLAPATREQRRDEMVEMIGVLSKFKGMEMAVFPLVMRLLSSFEWSELHNALPQASQTGPIPMEQFMAQQQQMMQNPQTMDNLQNNIQAAQPALLNSLPAGGSSSGN